MLFSQWVEAATIDRNYPVVYSGPHWTLPETRAIVYRINRKWCSYEEGAILYNFEKGWFVPKPELLTDFEIA
jgi:hypothetical protein